MQPLTHDALPSAATEQKGVPPEHALPQTPHEAVPERLASQPFDALPSQLAEPGSHAKPQRPAAHVALAPATAGQAIAQRPQFATLVRVSVSHPLAAFMSQSAKPSSQVKPQVAVAHVGVAWATAGHARPHAPQCMTLARVSVSQPLAAFMSQSPKPASQVDWQRPITHDAVALADAAHAIPQPPQCTTLVCVSVSQPFEALMSQSP
jgi:hypothetical protein